MFLICEWEEFSHLPLTVFHLGFSFRVGESKFRVGATHPVDESRALQLIMSRVTVTKKTVIGAKTGLS